MTERKGCEYLLKRISLAITDSRSVAVEADGNVLTQDIMYVPVSKKGVGGHFEYKDGRPVEDNVLAGLASMGAIG